MLETEREIKIAVGKISPPLPGGGRAILSPVATNTSKCKDVPFETCLVSPIRSPGAMRRHFSCCSASFVLRVVRLSSPSVTAPVAASAGSSPLPKQRRGAEQQDENNEAKLFHGFLIAAG